MNYDLIIIGNTPVGRYAAFTASLWEARVALVTQEITFSDYADWLYNFTLSQLIETTEQQEKIQFSSSVSSTSYQKWAQEVIEVIEEKESLVKLTAKGVDIISGKGEFCRLPKQALIVNNEKLQAGAYLITTETTPIFPTIPNLSEIGYLTLADLRQKQTLETLPDNLTIVGDTPTAITLAQNLAKLNKKVTLSLTKTRLFPTEDQEIVNLLEKQLEADGIEILKQSPLVEIKAVGKRKWLKLGETERETDELIIIPQTQPNIEGLNLEGVQVSYSKQKLIVNEKLQTTNSKIYACGCILGGYSFLNLAQYEAKVALKNALLIPRHQVNYQPIPCVISTHPAFGRVGMTEAQAQSYYQNQVIVIKEYFKTNLVSLLSGEITGLFKIVVHRNGKILGGHIFGKDAAELASILAMAISRKMTMKQLTSISFPSLSIAEMMTQVLEKWEVYYDQCHPFLRWLRRRYNKMI